MEPSSAKIEDPGADGGKIGPASHGYRTLGLLAALASFAGAMVIYYTHQQRTDAGQLEQLESFRAAYAQQCAMPSFTGETPPMVRDLYLSSPTLRAVVEAQSQVLKANGSCDSVSKALREADFPMPERAAADRAQNHI